MMCSWRSASIQEINDNLISFPMLNLSWHGGHLRFSLSTKTHRFCKGPPKTSKRLFSNFFYWLLMRIILKYFPHGLDAVPMLNFSSLIYPINTKYTLCIYVTPKANSSLVYFFMVHWFQIRIILKKKINSIGSHVKFIL